MRNIIAAAALAAAFLAGCAHDPMQPLERAAEGLQQPAEAGDKRLAQKIADQLLGEVAAREHRGVRFCFIAAGISELMSYRVIKFDPDYAVSALGHIAVLESLKDRYGAGDALWFETDLQLALFDVASILVDAGRDRVPELLANFAGGGVNIPGVLERVRLAGGQAALADAVVADIRHMLADLQASGVSTEAALASCSARLEQNRRRVAVIAGAAG